ncbi:MAG: hypothetical protein P8Z30_11285 [Acidobacteriota bacterium]
MEIRRIAILTLSAGPGHLRASQAIHQALHDGADNVEARTINVLDLAERWFLRSYVRPYFLLARSGNSSERRLRSGFSGVVAGLFLPGSRPGGHTL